MTPNASNDSSSPGHRQPLTTHWSVVVAAGQQASPDHRAALATLCEAYWYPLYAYVRRRGYQVAEAQDLTQSFFASLLQRDSLQLADQQRGKFRSFLLAALNHFLANARRHATAQKRGGAVNLTSLDLQAGESRYQQEPADEMTPERIFERRWAMTLLDQALARLRDEFLATGKLDQFELLRLYLGGIDEAPKYEVAAERLHMSPGAVKVAVHRMRRRCRELLREEVAQTVARPDDVDDELRHLFTSLAP